MEFYGITDIGKLRKSNQDFYIAEPLSENAGIAIVCDGMGGVGGGNVASETAVRTVWEHVADSYHPGMNAKTICNLLKTAVAAANIRVFDLSKTDDALAGMGTTIVIAFVADGIAHILYAGDSRAYLLQKDTAPKPLTRDHSIVQSLLESGQLTEAEARVHPRKNIITRALGVDEMLDIDYLEEKMPENGALLLCTDGLTNYVEAAQLEKIVQNTPYSDCPKKLVKAANANGGGDNITVVLIAAQPGSPLQPPAEKPEAISKDADRRK